MKRWIVLLGCFIGMSVAMPAILLVPMGLFLKSVTTEFGWTRTEFSLITAATSMFNALTMPIAGFLVDRYGATRTIALGTLLGCGCYAALALANSFASIVVLMGAAITLGNLASYPAFMSLTQRWFDKRLGLAFAMTSTGLAVGIGVASYVIADTIAHRGWRMAFATVGIGALAIGLANLLLFVRDNRGPVPLAEQREKVAGGEDRGSSLGEALRTQDFWLFAGAFLLVILAVVGCNVHLPALLSDRGATTAEVASVVAIGSVGSLIGRLVTGVMLDRFAFLFVAALFLAGQAAGFLFLLDGLHWVSLASFLLGAVQGAEIDMLGYAIARRFGRVAYARVYGTCFALTLVGAILGPIIMASIFDRTGSYRLGLETFPLLPLLAFAMLGVARLSPKRRFGRDPQKAEPVQ